MSALLVRGPLVRSLSLLLVLFLGGALSPLLSGPERPPVVAEIPSALQDAPSVSLGLSDLPPDFSTDVPALPGALPPLAASALMYCLGLFGDDLVGSSESAFTRDDGLVSVYSLVASFYTVDAASAPAAALSLDSDCLASEFLPSLPQVFEGLDLSRVEVLSPELPAVPAGVSIRMLRFVVPLAAAPASPVFLDVAVLSRGSVSALYTSTSGGAPLPLATSSALLSALASRLPSDFPSL